MNEVAGGVPDSDPWIRYKEFGYFAITMTVYLRIREYFDHLVVRHEFIKRLHRRFREEQIDLPFPIKSAFIPMPVDKHRLNHPATQERLSDLPFLQKD
ncbi:MAG: hypothetical protein AAFQ89_01985 [Cyanobacteria bacterium J06626_18]